jgi:WD40 repeat protein/tRNA A-37 threonylcarbamoyl transferase component Bud32
MIPCLKRTDWQQLLEEGIEPGQHGFLEQHLHDCPPCQRIVHELTSPPASPASEPGKLSLPVKKSLPNVGQDANPDTKWGPNGTPVLPALLVPAGALGRKMGLRAACSELLDDPSIPKIPGYDVLREQGNGGMGVVYKAVQTSLNRVVALKMIRQFDMASSEQLMRFRLEAELAAQVKHPNIVQVYEVGTDGKKPYLAMEWVPGGSLADHLDEKPQDPRQAAALVEVLARAVHAAHSQGVIHRDLKPGNILLQMADDSQEAPCDEAGNLDFQSMIPKITDFGLARPRDAVTSLTDTGLVVGTPEYMSPEQAAGKKYEVGVATDIYSLGAILYELLAGRTPFRGDSAMETLRQVVEDNPPSFSSAGCRIPRDMETICRKCLEKKPGLRYASAAALADDLRRWLNREPIRARPLNRVERLVRWCQRRPVHAAFVGAIVLLAAIGLTGILWQWRQTELARADAVELAGELEAKNEELRKKSAAERWQAYRTNLQVVSAALANHKVGLARQALAAAPPEHRGWEWHYFDSYLDSTLHSLHAPAAPTGGLAFSPDGLHLAAGVKGKTICLWDLGNHQIVKKLTGLDGDAHRLTFSADGQRLAALTKHGFQLYDVETGTLLAATDKKVSFLRATFSPDSALVVAHTTFTKTLSVWDARSGDLLWTWHKSCDVASLAFHPGSKQLAVSTPKGDILLLDAATGQQQQALGNHAHVRDLACSPDGSKLVSAGRWPDATLQMWDLKSGKRLLTMRGHKNAVNAPTFSPDGTRLVSLSNDQTARLWDAKTGGLVMVLGGNSSIIKQAWFNAAGSRLYTVTRDNTLRAWDGHTGDPLFTLYGLSATEEELAFLPQGGLVAAPGTQAGTLDLFDLDLGESLRVLRGHSSFVYDVAFSPSGALIGSAAWDGTVRLWDGAGKSLAVLKAPSQVSNAVAFDPHTGKLAANSHDQGISIWDVPGGKLHRFIKMKATQHYGFGPAFHPTQSLVAAGLEPGFIDLWDLKQGKSIASLFTGSKAPISRVCFHPDGSELAAVNDAGMVFLWDLASRQLRASWKAHDKQAVGVAYSPDGRLLATSSPDGSVRLWDSHSDQRVALLKHPCQVYHVSFHPDGKRLATSGADHLIRIWDTASWEEVAQLQGHQDYVHSVAFSPDGTRLVSGSGDFTVRLWDTLPLRERVKKTTATGTSGA